MNKRGWISWFMWNTNKTLRQEVSTTYVGHRYLSIFSKERRRWGLSSQILEAPGIITRLGEHPCSRWEFSQKRREWEETTWGESVFTGTDPFSLFSRFAYILFVICRDRIQSHAGSADMTLIKIRCFIQTHTKVLRDLHHLLALRPAYILWPLFFW